MPFCCLLKTLFLITGLMMSAQSTFAAIDYHQRAEQIRANAPSIQVENYTAQNIDGWPVYLSNQLLKENPERMARVKLMLKQQMERVKNALPADIVTRLQDVPIWISPTYEGTGPKAEYHPGAGWLKANGRHPQLVKCVEITNTQIFEKEIRRMPVLLLHELAHAYHDQVLGFQHSEVKAAYEAAKEKGIYEQVALRANGKLVRSYALTNEREYFAELTESYFGINDFYPVNREELQQHDPHMAKLLPKLWGVE